MFTIKKILCPVDFHRASLRALKYASNLAAEHNAKLRLLNVVTPIMTSAYPFPSVVASASAVMRTKSERQIKKLTAKVKVAGAAVDSEVTVGEVDLEIERAVRKYKPDLVAMGTHGRRGFERWFIGSTTERLLRRCPVPLLTIADASEETNRPRFKRILVTTDFSNGTSDAVRYALAIGRENDASITLLHVVPSDAPFSFENGSFPIAKIENALSELLPAKLEGSGSVDIRVSNGTPYQVILDTVEKATIDLLVMNIHGKGMLDRALLGSTAERVVRASRVPVMMIPPAKAGTKLPAQVQAA